MTNHTIPVAKALPIHRGWLRGLAIDAKILAKPGLPGAINSSGKIFLDQQLGSYSPVPFAGATRHIGNLGIVTSPDAQATDFQSFVTALPLLGPSELKSVPWTTRLGIKMGLDQAEHVRNVIEIIPSPTDPTKLTVFERRMETLGTRVQDRSKHIYAIMLDKIDLDPVLREQFSQIVDTRDIKKVMVNPDKSVTITYQPPEKDEIKITLPGSCFRDNYGHSMLDNPKAKLTSPRDIYQRDTYSVETMLFQPEIGIFGGVPALVVHKVWSYDIKKPDTETFRTLRVNYQVFPSTGYSALQMENAKWLPVNDYLFRPQMIDRELSGIINSDMPAAVNCQNRIGNEATIVYQQRDIYFYGMQLYAKARTIFRYGSNFGLNFFKGLVDRGINSGRTYTESAVAIFRSAWTKLHETNNPHYNKVMSHGQEVEATGVGEDQQRITKLTLEGLKNLIMKTLDNIMSAEGNAEPSGWGPVNNQNTKRYIFSRALAAVLTKLIKWEMFLGNITRPAFSSIKQIFETLALKFWYDWPLAEIVKLLAAPVFLLTRAYVPFLPVDQILFVYTWCKKTVSAIVNFCFHLKNLALRPFRDGFINNSAIELSFLYGYSVSALTQFYERNQFTVFFMTHAGRGKKVPLANQVTVWGLGAFSLSAVMYGFYMIFATSGAILAGMFGVVFAINQFFCGFQTFICGRSAQLMRQANKGWVTQKNMGDYAREKAADSASYQDILASTRAFSAGSITDYNEMFDCRAALKGLLINLNAINKNGRVALYRTNAYGLVANEMLDIYTNLEMAISLKATDDLRQNIGNLAARQAVRDMLHSTKNFMVVDTLAKTFRKLHLTF